MEEIGIPDFITLVATQIREAMRRFKSTGDAPLLHLTGLHLHIAFTAEKSSEMEKGIELKPWIVSAKGGKSDRQGQQIVHAVTLDMAASIVEEVPPPFLARELQPVDFPLVLETARQLRDLYQIFVYGGGPDGELVPPFTILWRTSNLRIEIRKRLAKHLLQNIDTLNSIEDMANLYEGAMEDLTFVPIPSSAPPPLAASPIVGFR